MRIQPTHSYVLVRKLEEETTKGGIVLPSGQRTAVTRAKVLATGQGDVAPDGKRYRPPCCEGNTVLILATAGVEVEHGGEKLLLVHAREVVAVLLRDGPEDS